MVTASAAVAERELNWKAKLPDRPLGQHEIHLWFADIRKLESEGHFDILQQSDLERSQRIIDVEKRQLYLGGRAGLRLALAHYSGLTGTDLKFRYGDRGKPELANRLVNGTLQFNYTVSSERALYSFAWNRELGVDLEILPRRINFESMARRKLSGSEQEVFAGIPYGQKNDAMLACWTRKEAYGKVLGVGIRYHMNRVPLFGNLHLDQWSVGVSGLFEEEDASSAKTVSGVQLSLPCPGVAAMMYQEESQDLKQSPAIFAYQLK